MLKSHSSIEMLETVAEGMGYIGELDAVYVGGAVACLYIDDESIGQVRATKDVDCTVEILSYINYHQMEEILRQHGFQNVIGDKIPLCRWSYKGVLVDIMPDDESIIGFTNTWYKEGRKNRISISLPSGRYINIFPLEYFLASKVEAFKKRGKEDFLGSKDMEDIITVLDGTIALDHVLIPENPASQYVKTVLSALSQTKDFVQSITGHIEHGDAQRADRIINYINSLS